MSTTPERSTLFVHATGFCKELWNPVIDMIQASWDGSIKPVLVDLRGHGENAPHRGPFDWHSLALDLVAVVERLEGPVVGVGHSSGGAALARTEILRPGTFERLVLIEPIIFPGPYERREIPRAVGAERRRRAFRSRDAAWERFATGPFKAWDRRVLDQYVEHGFIETDEGWTLRCDPGVEAEIYREGSNVDTWEYLDTIRCPVRIVCGSDSDTHQPPYLDELTDRFPNAHLVVLDGVGHLAPMEAPERIAETIR